MSDSERCCSLLKTCWHRTETSSLELLVGLRKCWKAHSLLLLAPCTCWTLLVRENSSHIADNEWKSPILFFFFLRGFSERGGVSSLPLPHLGRYCSPLCWVTEPGERGGFWKMPFVPFLPTVYLVQLGVLGCWSIHVKTKQTCLPLDTVISKERSQPWNKGGFR